LIVNKDCGQAHIYVGWTLPLGVYSKQEIPNPGKRENKPVLFLSTPSESVAYLRGKALKNNAKIEVKKSIFQLKYD
jgi:hypothetical protein